MEDFASYEQVPFGTDSFAENPEPRCPCILLLDTSISMSGAPMRQLNEGVRTLKEELLKDSLASKRVELAVITFGPVELETDFRSPAQFFPKELETTGDTPMGEAILLAIELLKRRKQDYKQNGIAYYKPWIILITDGSPTDEYQQAAYAIKEGEKADSFAFFAIGVENADLQTLSSIAARTPLKLKGLMFKEFFIWLSASMKMVSNKNPGTAIKLISPTGWADL